MTAYYNEIDRSAAAWLRELIADGLIAPGYVDERSIVDVQGSELKGYTQVHLFAGIGGWSYALRLAGWADDDPVWTGSCPCQPFSVAGKRKGTKDDRHLWPHMARLIREFRPSVVFGEQVEGAVRIGWLDGVFGDLEAAGYACGAVVLGAHSIGSPHIRQRLYWVADGHFGGCEELEERDGEQNESGVETPRRTDVVRCDVDVRLADSERTESRLREPNLEGQATEQRGNRPSDGCDSGWLANSSGGGFGVNGSTPGNTGHIDQCEQNGRMGHAGGEGLAGRTEQPARQERTAVERAGHWSDSIWHPCRDGKKRRIPTEPSLFPLAHGIPERMGCLRGAGIAIVPQVAAEFVMAYTECM